jgi:hypothetical protein
MKKNMRNELLLLGISPFLALPLMLKNLIRREKYQILTFSLFFAILGYFFIPPEVYDLHQRYLYYTTYTPSMFSEYNDYFLGIITVIGRFLGLKPNILGFISAFILYYYLLKIGYETTARKITTNKKYVIYMVIYALSVPLVFFNGVRFPVGVILYIYGIYSYYYKNERKKAYIYMILGALSHFTVYIFIFIFILFEFVFSKIKAPMIWKAAIIIAFILGSSSGIMTKIILGLADTANMIAGHEIFSVATYVTGEWGAGRYDQVSAIEAYKGMITVLLMKIMFLLHSLLRKSDTPLYKFTLFLSIITLFVAPFATLFDRLGKILIMFILVLNTNNRFLEKERNKTNLILSVMLLLFSFILFFELKEEYAIFINSYIANPIVSGFRILVELL